MNKPLKPCPFCGGEALVKSFSSCYWVRCSKCDVVTATASTEQDAKEIWNKRYTDT